MAETLGGMPPRQEKDPEISQEQVIESLRANPQDYSQLDKYREQKERTLRTAQDTLAYNLEEAEIMRDAGKIDAARRAFEDVIELANQLYDSDTEQKARQELSKL